MVLVERAAYLHNGPSFRLRSAVKNARSVDEWVREALNALRRRGDSQRYLYPHARTQTYKARRPFFGLVLVVWRGFGDCSSHRVVRFGLRPGSCGALARRAGWRGERRLVLAFLSGEEGAVAFLAFEILWSLPARATIFASRRRCPIADSGAVTSLPHLRLPTGESNTEPHPGNFWNRSGADKGLRT